MLDFTSDWHQGWYLTLLSSCMCILGCFIIYLDDIYYLIVPKFLSSRYRFKLKENYTFLNGSLSFSSGCLLFTSLFRLLPEALEYFNNSVENDGEVEEDTERKLHFYLIISYIGGILLCLLFNRILHLVTSESVIHCNHSGNDGTSHSNTHSDTRPNNGDDLESGKTSCKGVSSHSHPHESPDSSPDRHLSHSHTHNHASIVLETEETGQIVSETSPLINDRTTKVLKSKQSILHYLTPSKSIDDIIGECKGYSSAELCLFKNHQGNIESKSQLHFCEIPTLRRHTEGSLIDMRSFHSDTHFNDDHDDNYNHEISSKSTINSQSHSAHEDHSNHKEDHHHHVSSPLSRLLLIGVQTTLAITLHKFPEGFITFITSETNPQLGISIFLSLLLHNFTEGFSMCLPLYYSFTSSSKKCAKVKAVSISAILGGFSQPLGALLGYVFLKMNHAKSSDGNIDIYKLNFIFGITLAITSGFLSVIGLTMYGSAVSFGGSSNFVMIWCLLGMSIIGLSSIVAYD